MEHGEPATLGANDQTIHTVRWYRPLEYDELTKIKNGEWIMLLRAQISYRSVFDKKHEALGSFVYEPVRRSLVPFADPSAENQ